MKRILFILGACLICQSVFAFDIVYPKKSGVIIDSSTSFFIGSSNKPITINGEKVELHSSGGFAHVIPLSEGENKFEIKSDEQTQNFTIIRPKKLKTEGHIYSEQTEFKSLKYCITSVNNAPLRETPINSGINRIAHLQMGIPLIVDGEKNGFYRIVLGTDKKGWISKLNVKDITEGVLSNATVNGYDYIDSPDYFTFVFHLDRKVPFEIEEGENMSIKFFNVKNCDNDTYIFDFPYAEAAGTKKSAGYSGSYDGNDFVLKIRKFPLISQRQPLKNITIAVDAGHGGSESGAIGCLGDKEKDVTLSIAGYLEYELKRRGAKVVMARKDDSYVGLQERVDIANENDAMFLISIHANALPDHLNPNEHRGTSVYYYYNQAKLLAAYILCEINTQLGTQNDKIRQGSLALVRNTKALSVLIETAYLINPYDNAMLIEPKFQKLCAKAIADGIEKYLKDKI